MKIEIKVNRYRAADGTDYRLGEIAEVSSEEGAAAIAANVGVEFGSVPVQPPVATSVPEPKPVEPVSKRERPPGKSREE